MNKKLKLNLFLLTIMILMATLFTIQSGEDEFLPTRNIEIQGASFGTILQIKQKWTLLEKVEEAMDLLEKTPPLEVEERGGRVERKQIEIAILDVDSGEIFISRYWLDNDDINNASKLTRTYQSNKDDLPHFTPVDPNEEFRILNRWWNSWNSEWYVVKNGSISTTDFIVIADKYSLFNSYIIYPEDQTGSKYSDIIYAPYSEGVHTEETVKAGLEFLREKVGVAFEELLNLQVESRAFPGKLVVDTINPEFAKNILLVEQTDPDAILNNARTDDEKLRVAERVLVRYGLNGDKTFRYTVSSAGASGPAQVMASTGNLMVRRYPTANLIKDIDLGRVDMINAIKLQLLVFDDHMTEVINRVDSAGSRAKQIFSNLTEEQLDEVRAMIYNGGASKYNTATGGLRTGVPGYSETSKFIQKLRTIILLELFN